MIMFSFKYILDIYIYICMFKKLNILPFFFSLIPLYDFRFTLVQLTGLKKQK